MKTVLRLALLGAAAVAFVAPVQAQDPMKAEVIHWWTSGGESAAVQVLAKRFEASGGQWVDSAVAGGEAARAAAINRMVGGNPPTMAQFNTGRQFDDLVAQGLLNPLDDVASAGKWADVLPATILDAITRDGSIYAVPVNIHGQNWMFYSKPVFDEAGIASSEFADWDAFFAAMDKIKATGKVPVALGGQPWQEMLTFNLVLASVGGKDLMESVYGKADVEAVKSPEFKKAVEIFGRLRDYVDAGAPGRNWNDATNMVITNAAGVQFMGDWAKGEFQAANKALGSDWGCEIGPGEPAYVIGGDVFVFPKTDDEAQKAAQAKLATSMLDPETQIEFNLAKGSIPVRTDVPGDKFDACGQKAIALMADPARQVGTADLLASADLNGALQDVVTQYFNNPSQSADDMIASFAEAVESAG